ncbi:hypothetical protein [Kibdelosporangium aridum]|uniref:Uncharacterized protein n=1 Tax=Kibdelosporangium aridum TaxID=2030 RepID=A0A1W2CK43_KIBAR|nr:hypothetical protein [Kibdelosporangium aridum]SMC85396.1 hypothetical protein SAMN05661093_02201 [Kibdelosporangium aridum]
MDSVEPTPVVSASGVTRTRCEKCKKFARLLPGDTECSTCLGALALTFGDITTLVIERGGW